MADPKGVLTTPRVECARRPARERVQDWNEVYDRRRLLPVIRAQAGRCKDCGVPFCHYGCPLGNLIPEWNDLAWRGDWAAASERRSEEHTSELQSRRDLVCRLLLEKKNRKPGV